MCLSFSTTYSAQKMVWGPCFYCPTLLTDCQTSWPLLPSVDRMWNNGTLHTLEGWTKVKPNNPQVMTWDNTDETQSLENQSFNKELKNKSASFQAKRFTKVNLKLKTSSEKYFSLIIQLDSANIYLNSRNDDHMVAQCGCIPYWTHAPTLQHL